MNERKPISNYLLFGLGALMAVVGIWAVDIEVRNSTNGFALFACLFSVYVIWHSTTTPSYFSLIHNNTNERTIRDRLASLRRGPSSLAFVCKNVALVSFSISVITVTLLEIASKSNISISNNYAFSLLGSYIFLVTLCVSGLCILFVVAQYMYRKLAKHA